MPSEGIEAWIRGTDERISLPPAGNLIPSMRDGSTRDYRSFVRATCTALLALRT